MRPITSLLIVLTLAPLPDAIAQERPSSAQSASMRASLTLHRRLATQDTLAQSKVLRGAVIGAVVGMPIGAVAGALTYESGAEQRSCRWALEAWMLLCIPPGFVEVVTGADVDNDVWAGATWRALVGAGMGAVIGAAAGAAVGAAVGSQRKSKRWDRFLVSFAPQRDGRFGLAASIRF